ncbi:glycosyltransferase family 2 protein [Pseudofrankia sp. DC12]|uniref:glycosyltransferase family 2 protein n=1 Tax=Pseudofrankia sp. DC12 TaxID=683315 RepID=UPI0006990F8B|nr:glycosyltransferase family 2 protein [Pseudofrankia sp. DC12]
MPLTSTLSVRDTLARRDNEYTDALRRFEQRHELDWHAPTPAETSGGAVSVVIPARNVAYCLGQVLDALRAQDTRGPFEVIVVDDASTDATFRVAVGHPLGPTVVRLPSRQGSAAARNAGTALAQADTVLFLDADMVLPPHALADVAARATADLVLVGFRHNVPFTADGDGHAVVPVQAASLAADLRVRWTPPVETVLPYSGITLTAPLDGRPLDATDDLRALGEGRWYYDWDLPRMVVTAVMAAPRAALLDVGGLHAAFGRTGWGCEDTYLGAVLIAAGLRVAPLRQLVGYHLDPPDAPAAWAAKLATWPDTLALYRRLLAQPPPGGQSAEFLRATRELLADCEVLS